MARLRHLEWDGCFNVRDLGGLPTTDGRETVWRRVVRADSLEDLTAGGWEALAEYGIRTVIDLRNDDEIGTDAARRPTSVTTTRLPLDASDDREFWDDWATGPQFATPLYYHAHLERYPERSAAILAAIARAEPGGVAFHCVGGRDRSGQVSMLLLALAGVAPKDIAMDYSLSAGRLTGRYAAQGEEDQGPQLERFLEARGTSAAEVIAMTLADLNVEDCLLGGGLTADDLTALRDRLLRLDVDDVDG